MLKRAFILFAVIFWCFWGEWGKLSAFALPTTTYNGATVVDVNQLSFSDMPTVQTSGGFSVNQIAEQAGVSSQSIIDYLGYDPSRSWSPGTPLSGIYKMGDFGNTLQSWSIQSIADNAGRPVFNQTLDNFDYLNNESIRDLASDIPNLTDVRIFESPVLVDAVMLAIGAPTITYTQFNPIYSLNSKYTTRTSSKPGYSRLFNGSKYIKDIPNEILNKPTEFFSDPTKAKEFAQYFVPDKIDDYLKKFDTAIHTSRGIQQILNSPLKDILSGKSSYNFSDSRIKGVLKFDIDTSTKLSTLDLSQYKITDLPNFENAKFEGFVGWKGNFLEDIQNLPFVPILKFVGGLTAALGAVGKIDIAFGEKEANRTNTVTGSYQDGFKVPCNQDNCAHLELTDAFDNPLHNLKGKQWISGNSQQVNGGSGFLKFVNGGKEPTGRHPFGDFFKVLLTTVDESTGTANFGVNFRICIDLWFARGCTPYFIGPLPWFSQKEKDVIFLGLDGVEAPIPISYPPLPVPDFDPYRKDLPTTEQTVNTDGVMSSADDPCATYRGVNLWAFREAMAKKESSGDYNAVGVYVPDGGNGLKGRALGRYQFMTYREDVSALYRSQGAGKHIEGAKDPDFSKEELRQSIAKYFPQEVQEKFWRDWAPKLIDRAYSTGLSGDNLVARAASFHLTGLRGGYNSSYGETVKGYYQSFLVTAKQRCNEKVGSTPISEDGDGVCTGEISHPAPGSVVTTPFGWVPSQNRNHSGIDYAKPIGTPILAADGGEVTFVSPWECSTISSGTGDTCNGRAGNFIVIKHCGGWKTRYLHLQKEGKRPAVGQRVSKGQVIANMGSSGASSGSHLHFELIQSNGQKQDPPAWYGKKYYSK